MAGQFFKKYVTLEYMKNSTQQQNTKNISAESQVQTLAQKITAGVGSPTSIILHTIGFILFFCASFFGISFNTILLVLTTIVSLEAIYLSLLIQMTVNMNTQSLQKVESDIDEIEEDFSEMRSDVEEITEDFGEMREDVEEISEDIGEMEETIGEIREDVGEITEEDVAEEKRDESTQETLENIQVTLQKLMTDLEKLKQGK